MSIPSTKRCPKCLVFKPWEDFAERKSASDGKQAWCRACQKVYKAQLRNPRPLTAIDPRGE